VGGTPGGGIFPKTQFERKEAKSIRGRKNEEKKREGMIGVFYDLLLGGAGGIQFFGKGGITRGRGKRGARKGNRTVADI